MLHYLHFSRQLWKKLSLYNERIINVYINVYVRCLHASMLVFEKNFGRKQLTVLYPWLHPVCDVAKAGLL